MIFENFCKDTINHAFIYSKSNLSSEELNVLSKLTENFFIDCFLGHQLQELLISEKKKNASENFQRDFQFMLKRAIIRTPLYNLKYTVKTHPEVCDREDYEKKQKNMRKDTPAAFLRSALRADQRKRKLPWQSLPAAAIICL